MHRNTINIYPLKIKLLSVFFLIVTLALLSFSDPYTIKRISDENFRYEFYTTTKAVTAKQYRTYYWFKGGAIHQSESGMVGELLDGKFTKMFLGNQLAEQGTYSNGLKKGVWKTWYLNGVMESKQYWDNGFKKGSYFHYDNNGQLIEKGNYRSNKKQGKWINYTRHDTIVYKQDQVFVKKPKLTKEEKEKAKEDKATAKAAKKEAEKTEKELKSSGKAVDSKPGTKKGKPATKKAKNKNVELQTEVQSEKPGFFKRLFSKKDKKSTNAKGA